VTGQTPPGGYREAFARLAAHRHLSGLDQRIIDAFGRLATGQAVVTDGALTISNLCAEAGISRASYYRSPAAAIIRELLAAGQVSSPEIDILRGQVRELKQAERRLRREHATQIRELRETVTAYANRIQVLALRNAELEEHNRRLLAQLTRADSSVIPLQGPSERPGGSPPKTAT
jgi:hypothetical protein